MPVGAIDLDPNEPVAEHDGRSASVSMTSTGWASGAGAKAAHPYPGTSAVRATMRRVDGWSMATRTTASGRAPSWV